MGRDLYPQLGISAEFCNFAKCHISAANFLSKYPCYTMYYMNFVIFYECDHHILFRRRSAILTKHSLGLSAHKKCAAEICHLAT